MSERYVIYHCQGCCRWFVELDPCYDDSLHDDSEDEFDEDVFLDDRMPCPFCRAPCYTQERFKVEETASQLFDKARAAPGKDGWMPADLVRQIRSALDAVTELDSKSRARKQAGGGESCLTSSPS